MEKTLKCWFCRKSKPLTEMDKIEIDKRYAAYGYGYCKSCIEKMSKRIKLVGGNYE